MLNTSAAQTSKEVLVIDSDQERGKDFIAVLGFMALKARLISPEKLAGMTGEALFNYFAIFSIETEMINQQFLKRNQAEECQYPVILMVERNELNTRDVVVQLPYIAGLCFQSDYYSLQRVLDQAGRHNRKERRMHKRECQQLLGNSEAIVKINAMIDQVSDSNATVLILGASGTGKEVIARNIHAQSARRKKPFVPINCGAIPADLLESELFGHEKGAFTGAISSRQGRFELAEGGVLFLDEIGDMPLAMQVKILRVLQERCYEKIGSNRSIQTDVRIIAATHHRLEDLIAEGKFREDLFYRLNVFPVWVPPLCERVEDIPLLIGEISARIARGNRGSIRLKSQTIAMLQQYSWPGNVRELANLMERLAILYPYEVIAPKHLPDKYQIEALIPQPLATDQDCLPVMPLVGTHDLPAEGLDMKTYIEQIEISFIRQALMRTNDVVKRAAELLKVKRTTLVEKMRKYHIERIE